MATDTYQKFRCALRYLTGELGYSTRKVVNTAELYGYEGIAHLCPNKPQPQQPTDSEQSQTDESEKTETLETLEAMRSELNRYGVADHLTTGQQNQIESVVSFVEGRTDALEIDQRMKEAFAQDGLAAAKRWVAVAALLHGPYELTRKQMRRRDQIVERMNGNVDDALVNSRWLNIEPSQDDQRDYRNVVDSVIAQARRWKPQEFGSLGAWLSQNVSVQPNQTNMGIITDWIEVNEGAKL